jgi:PKD domain-containing protein
MSKPSLLRWSVLVTFALGFTGCTTHPMDGAPALTGPSAFGRQLQVTVTPDSIIADGSQSAVVATLVDPNGAGVAGQALQVSITAGGVPIDFGSLSSRTIYTGSNGRATVIYTAPMLTGFFAGGPATQVAITVTPVGNNYETAVAQHAVIKVTPPPVPVAEPGAPTAGVTYLPATPKVGEVVNFDASSSKAGTGHSIATYFWNFGDNQPNDEHGSDASHAYQAPGQYTAILGVADELGRMSSTFKTVVVVP